MIHCCSLLAISVWIMECKWSLQHQEPHIITMTSGWIARNWGDVKSLKVFLVFWNSSIYDSSYKLQNYGLSSFLPRPHQCHSRSVFSTHIFILQHVPINGTHTIRPSSSFHLQSVNTQLTMDSAVQVHKFQGINKSLENKVC